MESGRQSSVSGSLDSLVRHLLLSRVQDAVACLRDKDGVSERAMQRIAILVRFLEDTGTCCMLLLINPSRRQKIMKHVVHA